MILIESPLSAEKLAEALRCTKHALGASATEHRVSRFAWPRLTVQITAEEIAAKIEEEQKALLQQASTADALSKLDESINELQKFAFKKPSQSVPNRQEDNKSKVTNMSNSLDKLIPEWKDDDPLKLETYLAELKMAKTLK